MRGPLFDIIGLIVGNPTQEDVVRAVISLFSVLAIIFVVFPIHECAHAYAAKCLGDDTAERMGRVTLNPLQHIDFMGALLMMLCGIGWAKPTPVDLTKCTKCSIRKANVIVSAAGPLSNVLLAFVIMIIGKLLYMFLPLSPTLIYICSGLDYVVVLSLYLAVFNLIPVPPLDGYHVLASFLPAKALAFMERNGQVIHWIFFGLIIFGVLSIPISLGEMGLYWLLDKATFFLG